MTRAPIAPSGPPPYRRNDLVRCAACRLVFVATSWRALCPRCKQQDLARVKLPPTRNGASPRARKEPE